jgi:hypothetical protein
MILILLALIQPFNLTKTEFLDTIAVYKDYANGEFVIVTTEIWNGTIEWDAAQGDSLITSAISLGVYDYYNVCMDGIANMAIGCYYENTMPMNDWEVIIANTNSTNRIFRTVQPWEKWKAYLGFVARTTGLRIVKLTIVKYRIGG